MSSCLPFLFPGLQETVIPESAAVYIIHVRLTTWEDKGELNCQELMLSPPSFHAESMIRDNFLITVIMFPHQFIKRLSGHDVKQQFKAIDLSS